MINVKHGWILLQVQFDVFDIENGVYKLNFIYKQETGLYVHLSRAIEAFVNEIVYTSISAISSTEAVCVFLVKVYIVQTFLRCKKIRNLSRKPVLLCISITATSS